MGEKKNDNFRLLFKLVGVAFAVFWILSGVKGIKAGNKSIANLPDPIQSPTKGSEVMNIDGYNVKLTYLATYDVDALVVCTEDYRNNSVQNVLSPRDFALCWGKVAEYNDRINFNWKLGGRFYEWYVSSKYDLSPVGGNAGVTTHSANNHIIPADDSIRAKIKEVKVGDRVKIKGILVNADWKEDDGDHWWHSSTTREDDGDGACEIILVKDIQYIR